MDYLLIALVALFASALTFFSGFGLGTILTPVFLLFFPVEVAIALTGVVHFLNNLFKISLVGKFIHWRIGLLFGLTGMVGALIGAYLLFVIASHDTAISFALAGQHFQTSSLNLLIAALLSFFALVDLVPRLRKLEFSRNFAVAGGLLSGFFGGLSGHQGALRSAFLLRFGLNKEAFIATGILIACFIDFTRIGVYATQLKDLKIGDYLDYMLTAILAAFAGALIGNLLLKKVTLQFVHILVGSLILLISILLALGII